jgi:hypothetical protein
MRTQEGEGVAGGFAHGFAPGYLVLVREKPYIREDLQKTEQTFVRANTVAQLQ